MLKGSAGPVDRRRECWTQAEGSSRCQWLDSNRRGHPHGCKGCGLRPQLDHLVRLADTRHRASTHACLRFNTHANTQASVALPFQRDMARMLMYFNSRKKSTIGDLAKVYGIPEEGLIASLEEYNQSAQNKMPCKFGKAAEDVKELKGPLYIMDISIDSKLAPLTTLTLGGLKVNEETGEVLNRSIKLAWA